MRKALLFCCIIAFALTARSQQPDIMSRPNPDTVKLGIYVTSIHDIDFKAKEFNINFWIWLKYKERKFDFLRNLEIPNAKSFSAAYATIDSSGEYVTLLMKIQCTMKNGWRINNFPFDRQVLRITFENSQYDSTQLIFVPDKFGDHYDKRVMRSGNNDMVINGWFIDSFNMSSRGREYKTGFGEDNVRNVTYSALRVRINISRDADGLFWKMFLGMYIAFLIAYVCFYIHADGMDSRFGLSVGSIFAVIGNKYIIESSLPESTSFTLIDMLHGLTLICILIVISATTYSLKLVKQNKIKAARRFDMITAQVMLFIFLVLNIYFIYQANKAG